MGNDSFGENSCILYRENALHILKDIVPVQDISSCNMFDDMFDLQVLLKKFR